jgi:hypothetical protein
MAVWVAQAKLQPSEPYRILRFGRSDAKQDVILLGTAADAATLSRAIEALLAVRRAAGDVPESDAQMRVRSGLSRRPVLPWAGRVLRDLSEAEPRHVPRVGQLRAVRIWLPAQQRR